MSALGRRKLLAGGAVLGATALGAGALVGRRPRGRPSLDEIIDAIVFRGQVEIVGVAADFLRRGASRTDLLSGAFLAPILSAGDVIDPHPIAVVPSIFEHMSGSRTERIVPALWAVWNAAGWTQKKRVELVPAKDVEREVTRLGVAASHLRGDPHVAILAAQAMRALAWVDPRYAAPVLATVARRIDNARPIAAIRVDENDTTPPEAIADVLRSTDRTRTSGASLDGRSTAAIWQALCLIAIETRLAEGFTTNLTGGAGLHQTTLLDALWFIHDRASAEDRPFVLADAVDRIVASRRHGRPGPRFEEALARVRADEAEFVADLRREVATKGTGEHDFKFFGAAAAIAPKLPPAIRDRWWAAAWLADPVGSTSRWTLADEAVSLVAA
jgi:hypothetical protein